ARRCGSGTTSIDMRSPPDGSCTLLAQYPDYPLGYGTGIVFLNQMAGEGKAVPVPLSLTVIGIQSF
ncbi:MAG: hypothetical protein WCP86_06840, partial [bacterium]